MGERRTTKRTHADAIAVVLAGGNGSRLGQLTRYQAKPALPFGGHYRNIDFTLSNCVNSGLPHIGLVTQYNAHALIQHVGRGWGETLVERSAFIEVWPAQQREGKYAGTADAVYQNLDPIERHGARHVVVLAADHIYRMSYVPMLEAHERSGAEVTVACMEVPLEEASSYAVLSLDETGRIVAFVEKPARPRALPGCPGRALVSMGIYVFNRGDLAERLTGDRRNPASAHDFALDVLPQLVEAGLAQGYVFRSEPSGAAAYWRDVGTIDSYWQANMDLLGDDARVALDDAVWPIRTKVAACAPARLTARASAVDSIIAAGCRVDGHLLRSVLSVGAKVGAGSAVEDSLLLPGAKIGRNCHIERTIVDAGYVIPDGTIISSQRRATGGYETSPHGVVVASAAVPAVARPHREVETGLQLNVA